MVESIVCTAYVLHMSYYNECVANYRTVYVLYLELPNGVVGTVVGVRLYMY